MDNFNQIKELNPNGTHKPLGEALKEVIQGGLFAFCGAGISIPPPSCAPS